MTWQEILLGLALVVLGGFWVGFVVAFVAAWWEERQRDRNS